MNNYYFTLLYFIFTFSIVGFYYFITLLYFPPLKGGSKVISKVILTQQKSKVILEVKNGK